MGVKAGRTNGLCVQVTMYLTVLCRSHLKRGAGQGMDAPPTRKPYRITKQREKWTDAEHQRFLDAVDK